MLFLLLLAGAFIGVLGSFAGLGGGVLAVPLLLFLGLPAPQAVGTAFLAIFITSASGLAAHARLGHVNHRVGLALGLGGLAGAQLGAPLLHYLPTRVFEIVFSVILVGLAVRVLLTKRAAERAPGTGRPGQSARDKLLFAGLGLLIGVAAAFTGLGGGFLMVPLGIMLGMRVTEAVGTSFLGILIISSSALFAHARLADVDPFVGGALGVGGVLGAQLGPRLVRRTTQRVFAWIFATLLVAVASKILFWPG